MEPVLRDVGDADPAKQGSACIRHRPAADRVSDLARLDRPHAGQSVQQFGLPVAFDAAETDDFSGMQVETAVIDRNRAVIAMDDKLLDRNERRPAACRAAYRVRASSAPTIRRISSARSSGRSSEVPTTRPARMTTARSQQS